MKKLTLSQQKELCYVISADKEPALCVDAGEKVVVEIEDAWSGQIRKNGDERDKASIPFSNPVSGPIYVNGASKGDSLVVSVDGIRPLIGQGATRLGYLYGLLDSTFLNNFLGGNIPERTRIIPIKGGKVYFSDDVVLPYKPMIGTIATAPEIGAESSKYMQGSTGGNLDLQDVCIGNTIFLPVHHEGALLYLGDAHAIQGECELTGRPVEMPAEVTIKINISHKEIQRPRIESDEYIMTVYSTSPGVSLSDAVVLGHVDLILWLEEEYGFNRWDAWQLCGMVSEVRLGSLYTVAIRFPKKYLRHRKKNP